MRALLLATAALLAAPAAAQDHSAHAGHTEPAAEEDHSAHSPKPAPAPAHDHSAHAAESSSPKERPIIPCESGVVGATRSGERAGQIADRRVGVAPLVRQILDWSEFMFDN